MKQSELLKTVWKWVVDYGMTLVFVFVACVFIVLSGSFLAIIFCTRAYESISALVGVKEPEKYELLKFLGIGMGGVLLFWQALSSHKRAQAQADATREQARSIDATEQGRRQERLKNAIEHLGHETASVRLGGAYELLHLAEDKDAKTLRKTALDILCERIRSMTGDAQYRKTYKANPSEEVQSLLTLLFVQDHQVFKGLQANLQGSFLNGAVLDKADLRGADLIGAHLQEALLRMADLRGADLMEADLRGADLMKARMQEADLRGAYLQWADLRGAYLQWAYLREARMQEADLRGARMRGVDLRKARMRGADLRNAHLQGADLRKARMQAAALSGADLRGAGKYDRTVTKSFADRMKEAIGRKSDLSEVVFEGGLSQEYVDSLVNGLSGEEADKLRIELEPHVGRPRVTGVLPENCGAKLGTYSKEEAEQWIAEYNEAMSEPPKEQ